ncbi:hypothetical protein [Sorangium sp. So ce233]|uniref:hypothetical protein n=1 Tax=Sorangium sp. So ce233 TaxID=3133290 RepID=UPI003F606D3E
MIVRIARHPRGDARLHLLPGGSRTQAAAVVDLQPLKLHTGRRREYAFEAYPSQPRT